MPSEALATILMLIAIAMIIYGPWQTFCTDACRQTLFEIRDELFDMAVAKEIAFDSEEYRTIRVSIEQNIRYAHTLTIWRFLAILLHLQTHGMLNQKSELTKAIESIRNEEVRKKIRALSNRTTMANIFMMVAKAPAFIIFVLLFAMCSKVGSAFGRAKDHFSSISSAAGEAIQVEAEIACA